MTPTAPGWTHTPAWGFYPPNKYEDEMQTTFKIEKNIAIPDFKTQKKYPFDKMSVGDSFAIEGTRECDAARVRSPAIVYGRTCDKKFTIRKYENGYRCWRTK